MVVMTGGRLASSGWGQGCCSDPPPRARDRLPLENDPGPVSSVPQREASGPRNQSRLLAVLLVRHPFPGPSESSLPPQAGEYVDARDTNMGAWFEAKVIRVTRKVPAQDEPCSSTSSPKPEDDIVYHVKYDE